jgi:hypothetical protein
MKKNLLTLAVLCGALFGNAQAALVSVDFGYKMNLVDPDFVSELGLSSGDTFTGTFAYDNAVYAPGQLVAVSSLSMNFGSFALTNANDNFGGALVGLGQTGQLTAMYFETTLTLGGNAAGSYLLSFSGADAQLTPEFDPTLFKATASAVPLPAALPLLFAGLGVMGFVGRRRRQNEA